MNLSEDLALSNEQINEIWLCAANHIGLFLRWIIENGFEGEKATPRALSLFVKVKFRVRNILWNTATGSSWNVM